MEKNVKKEFKISGLHCASCGLKMEEAIKNVKGVVSAHVDFSIQKLKLELLEKDEKSIIEKSIEIIKDIEPHVTVIPLDSAKNVEHVKEEGIFKHLITLAGVIFFAFGFFVPKDLALYLFIAAYIFTGYDILYSALRNILKGNPFDENFLMSAATIGAFAIGEYPEGAAVMIFFKAGEFLQDLAVDKSRKRITSLVNIKPEYANKYDGGTITKISPDSLDINDIIIVKPGEKIPVDGEIIEGNSSADTRAITGESVPRTLNKGDTVYSGFVNISGTITLRVTTLYKDSTVSKILELVENASSRKSKAEKFITVFAKYYTPAVVFTSLAIAILPPLLGAGTFTEWIYRALIFLVVSCPCALVISIPLSFFAGIGNASKHGILIKGGNYLEALSKAEFIAFDKTGTLTKGTFSVTGVYPIEERDKILDYASAAESLSNHPIAKSITSYHSSILEVTSLQEIAGMGIKGIVNEAIVLCGNEKLMLENRIKITPHEYKGTTVYVAVNNEFLGYITISDEIKENSAKAVNELKAQGVRNIAMFTGDENEQAQYTAHLSNISEVYSGLLPHEKVELIEKKEREYKGKTVFVGDGINDAPVLMRADIGIAMGGMGSAAAIEAADIVIMNDDPQKVSEAYKISKLTKKIVYQNIALALGVKGVVMILGALGVATMWEAVFADVGVALLAVLNAVRVLR